MRSRSHRPRTFAATPICSAKFRAPPGTSQFPAASNSASRLREAELDFAWLMGGLSDH